MFVDAQGKEFESIQGRIATVLHDEDGFFQDGDRVVIVENHTMPYCISFDNHKEGCNDYEKYDNSMVGLMDVEEELIIEGDEE